MGRRGKDAAPHSDKDQGSAQMAAEERRSKKTAHLRPPRTAASRCHAVHLISSFPFLGVIRKDLQVVKLPIMAGRNIFHILKAKKLILRVLTLRLNLVFNVWGSWDDAFILVRVF